MRFIARRGFLSLVSLLAVTSRARANEPADSAAAAEVVPDGADARPGPASAAPLPAPVIPAAAPDLVGSPIACRSVKDCAVGSPCVDGTCRDDDDHDDEACPSGEPCRSGSPPPPREAPWTLDLDAVLSVRRASVVVFEPTTSAGMSTFSSTDLGVSNVWGVRYRRRSFALEAALPHALRSSELSTATTFAIGNPSLAAFWSRDLRTFRLEVGGLLTLPVASDGRGTSSALRDASSSRGLDRLWLWTPSSLAVGPVLRLGSIDGLDGIENLTELAAISLLSTTRGGGGDVIVQARERFGGRYGIVHGGVELEVVASPTHATGDRAQLSLLPYAGLIFPRAFVDASFRINTGDPVGWSFDAGGFWGLGLRGGLRL